jgi:hypothetical protein
MLLLSPGSSISLFSISIPTSSSQSSSWFFWLTILTCGIHFLVVIILFSGFPWNGWILLLLICFFAFTLLLTLSILLLFFHTSIHKIFTWLLYISIYIAIVTACVTVTRSFLAAKSCQNKLFFHNTLTYTCINNLSKLPFILLINDSLILHYTFYV